MTPSWYDVLDLDPSADAEEIRQAWRASIADLSPGDRGFRVRNEAAEVLLDPERRRAYDAQLLAEAEAETEASEAEAPGPMAPESVSEVDPETDAPAEDQHGAEPERDEGRAPATVAPPVILEKDSTASAAEHPVEAAGVRVPEPDPEEGEVAPGAPRPGGPSNLVLALLAVLALAMVALTAVVLIVQARASSVEEAADQGLAAAEQAIVPVLSYDYRQMEQSKAAAENFLTPSFSQEYDKLFAQLTINAPETETVVSTEVVASGIVSAEVDEVLAFVFINRPTQKQDTEPRVYRDQVTVRMQKVDDEWLVAELITATPPS